MALDGRLYEYVFSTDDGTIEQMSSDLGLNIATTSDGRKYFYYGNDNKNGFYLESENNGINVYTVINEVVGSKVNNLYGASVFARATTESVLLSSGTLDGSCSYQRYFLCAKAKTIETNEDKIVYHFIQSSDISTSTGSVGRLKTTYWLNDSTTTTTEYFGGYTPKKMENYLLLYPIVLKSGVVLNNVFLPIVHSHYGHNTIVTSNGKYVSNAGYSVVYTRPYLKVLE